MAGGDRAADHVSSVELNRFLSGELSGTEAAPVVAHLLTGCRRCREEMSSLALVVFAKGEPPQPPLTAGEEYDFPLFRAIASARRYASTLLQERQETPEDLPLKEIPPPPPLSAYERAVRDELRCRTLLERSRSLRQSDPEGMVITAALAVSIAERIEPEHVLGAAALADLQARAWAELGNAHRVAGDLASAETTLAHALKRSGQGTGDPRLLAVLMDFNASLYVDQRRFTEAIQLLDGIYTIYQALGEAHHAGRALISKGIATGYALETTQALALLCHGLLLIDAEQDPKLVLAGVHSLLYFLVEDGQLTEANHLLEISRPLYSAQGGSLDKLKARWLEGLIVADRGDDENAEAILREVRTGFAAAELPYDAALVSLALAEVLLRAGRTQEVTMLVEEMLALFRVHCIRREAIGAVLLQKKATQPRRPRSASG